MLLYKPRIPGVAPAGPNKADDPLRRAKPYLPARCGDLNDGCATVYFYLMTISNPYENVWLWCIDPDAS